MELTILIVAAVAHVAIGFYAFQHNPKSYTNRFFLTFTLIATVWGINQYLSLHQPTPEKSLDVIRWAMVLAALYSFSLFLTIHTFPSRTIRLSKLWLVLLSSLTLLVSILSRTPLIFSDIEGSGASAEPIPGPLIILFALTAGFFILGSIVLLILRFRKARGIYRAQLQYLLIGVMGSAFLLFFTNFVMVVLFKNTSLIILGPTYTLIFIGSTAYAMVTHRLFDVRVIIKRTVVYSVLLTFVSVTYAIIVLFFSQIIGGEASFGLSSFVPNIIAALLIAFGFDPLKRWLQSTTDKYLFKGEYDPQDVANNLARALSNAVNLDESLDSMMAVLTSEMRIGHVATLVVRRVDKDNVVKRIKATGFSNLVKLEALPTGHLIEYFAKHQELIVVDELKDQSERMVAKSDLHLVLNQLEQFQTAIALPLLVKNNVIGVLLIGEKLSGDIFSRQDLDVLELVGNQTALSIEKAQFYEEDKLKSEFISIASHELLTPTAAIEGYLSMALDKKMTQTASQHTQYIQRAYDSSRRLADLVKDLLSISRIESGRIKLTSVPLDVVAILDQAVGELTATAKAKGLNLTFIKPTSIPKVLADSDRVMQVCVNLINNSIKYTPKGGVTISVHLEKNMVVVEVKDTGIGIDKNDQVHLFEKFHRIDNPATAGIMGTGLGLYISKNIISLLGGEMTLQSATGQGSTFSFSLPVAK